MGFVTTDIYDVASSMKELMKQYLPDETADTLSLGTLGYITDVETTKIRQAAVTADELALEVFPNQAKLDKNIIMHAQFYGITDILAHPADMTILMGIKMEDLDNYMVNNILVIDKNSKILLNGEYEFHLDYDILLTRTTPPGSNSYVYTARYDITKKNPISSIDNPYLNQPYTMLIGTKKYIFIQCTIHQVYTSNPSMQIISSSIINNRSYTFSFDNQLADFQVKVVQDNKEYYITPVYEGNGVATDIEYYCYYLFVNSNTIRIKFEKSSFIPKIGAEVTIELKTTLGAEGNFSYSENSFVTLYSEKGNYPEGMNVLIRPNTDSRNGINRKTTAELHKIMPKEVLAHGNITTETDLNNYFNIFNTENQKIIFFKKSDSNVERIFYSYLLLKNEEGNIIPTNTISLLIKDNEFTVKSANGASILPAGTCFEYDPDTNIATICRYPTLSKSKYLYSTIYAIACNYDPLYTSFYMTIINESPYLEFNWINNNTTVQYIAEACHFERSLMKKNNTYHFEMGVTQNINMDMGLYTVEQDENGNWVADQVHMRAFLVFYKSGQPYRYKELEITDADLDNFKFTWSADMQTDNNFDYNNNIKIVDLGVPGTTETNYGYMDANTEAYIYTLIYYNGMDLGLHDFGDIYPESELKGWSVTNVFKVYSGLNFFINYTSIMGCKLNATINKERSNMEMNQYAYDYHLAVVPVVGWEYITDPDLGAEHTENLVEQLNYKKEYIDKAIITLENSFDIDFKFYNTYGPSRLYYLDENLKHKINRVDISFNIKVSVKSSSDQYTKPNIIKYIKNYIEDLDKLEDFHIPNLMSELRENFGHETNYIGFLGFDDYDANYQHCFVDEIGAMNKDIPPEFINVRCKKNDDTGEYEPMINVEITTL